MSQFSASWGNYLLKEMVETPAPDSISWWPQTIAWKLILLWCLVVVLKNLYQQWLEYQRNAYRREALAWLSELTRTQDAKHYRALPALLKKTAIAAFKRETVAALSGERWEMWLDAQCEQSNFVSACPNALHHLAYAQRVDVEGEINQTLLQQITLWVKHHRRPDD